MKVLIRPFFKSELSNFFNISHVTLIKWLKFELIQEELEQTFYVESQRVLTIKQCLIIFEHFGYPENIIIPQNEEIYKKAPVFNYYKSDLARLYKISKESLNFLISKNNNLRKLLIDKSKRKFYFKEVSDIFNEFGTPYINKNSLLK